MEHSCDTDEHEVFLRDGFHTPPTMATYAEFPPTFIFKSESNTILDFTSFDEDLYIPEPTESCEDTVGSESTTLLPSFLALKIDAMATDQMSSLSIPSLNTVSSNSTDQEGYEADSDRTNFSPAVENVSASSNTDTTKPSAENGQSILQGHSSLVKKPPSAQHPLRMPRRNSLGAYAA